ncbi:MAG: DUF5693 family protein, partial [Firmicutes bacterium]|nr:DUF5693 family protein [Bacillota bacterium]
MTSWRNGTRSGRWLAPLVLVAVVAALGIAWRRHDVERESVEVELCADLRESVGFARRIGMPVRDYLVFLREAGVVSVAVDEETVGSLAADGEVILLTGAEAQRQVSVGGEDSAALSTLVASERFALSDTFIVPTNPRSARFVLDRLPLRASCGPDVEVAADGAAFRVSLPVRDTLGLNLGVQPSALDAPLSAGLGIILRPVNFPGVTEKWIDTALGRSQKPTGARAVV